MISKRLAEFLTPLGLLLVAAFSYGVFALQQGFYWDDWVFAWTRMNMGRDGIFQLFSVTRPMRGWVETVLTSVLGAHPVAWQIYAMLVHWLAAVACWRFLCILWPSRRWQASLAAFLFLVYPGFTQQPLAMTYHYYWLFSTLFFLSLGLMVQAAQGDRGKWLKLGGAIGLEGLVLWAMEYLIGLEILRIIILWIALGHSLRDIKTRLKQTTLHYLPFLLVLGIYLYWRFIIYQGGRYSLDVLEYQNTTILFSLLSLISDTFRTLPLVSFGAWIKVLQQPFLGQDVSPTLALIYGFVLLGGAFGLAVYFRQFRQNFSASWAGWWEHASLAVLLLLFSGLPFHVFGASVRLSFPEDRYTLPFALGVSLFIVALFDLLKDSSGRFTLAALLIPLAMTLQINNANIYRKEWQSQRSFAWQLAWRAPHIQPGTTLLAEDQAFFPHNDDEAFTFLVNWAYEPDAKKAELPYDYFWISARLGYQLPGLQKGLPISMNHFAATFSGTTDRVLVLRFSPPSCLRILDPRYDAHAPILPRDIDALYADSEIAHFALPRATLQALPLSDPAALVLDGSLPPLPEWLFGEEPEHRWCYFFEKADLARQMEDWEKVARLGDQAFGAPYYPDDPAEYLPFIEAYGRLGRIEDAQVLTEKATDLNPALRPMLCAAWQRIQDTGQGGSEIILNMIRDLRYCP